jgi:hypothetical protein
MHAAIAVACKAVQGSRGHELDKSQAFSWLDNSAVQYFVAHHAWGSKGGLQGQKPGGCSGRGPGVGTNWLLLWVSL